MRKLFFIIISFFYFSVSQGNLCRVADKEKGITIMIMEKLGFSPSLYAEEKGVLYTFENLPEDEGDIWEVKKLNLRINVPQGMFNSETFQSWLIKELLGKGIDLQEVIMIHAVYFDTNSTLIKNTTSATLDKLIELMLKYPQINITLTVYADSRGSTAYNEILSAKRGKAIKDYLGTSPANLINRIKVNVIGEKTLLNNCHDGIDCDDVLHQVNRRAEFSFNIPSE